MIADACLRLGLPLRLAPTGIQPVVAGQRLAGGALPARHYGSVDVFLEALEAAEAGEVLVIDNGGRLDEACVGDLIALEAKAAGLAGLVVWGLHRDSAELLEIGLPVFSYGCYPAGPVRLDDRGTAALSNARFGIHLVDAGDVVFGDADGVLFVAADWLDELLATARDIGRIERRQASLIGQGTTLRDQTAFADYLAGRASDPGLTFRAHLRQVDGAIEE